MKTFVITIPTNEDSVKSTQQVVQSAKDVGYDEPIRLWNATLPHEWKKILPYENYFHNYARPDNVGACFASHYLLWKKCVELNEPILILEHDAIFKENLPDIDFKLCVTFGRPSYIRPDHMIYVEPKDGLQPLHQLNFLGHHAYAIKPDAAKLFCEDVKRIPLFANDVWVNTNSYPWLEEYRPYPIWADTDFSTIQTELPPETPIMQSYHRITNKDSDEYEYLLKHYPHVLAGPQSKRHIDV